MTLEELSRLYHLNREIEMDYRRLQALRDGVWPGGSSSGMPGGHGMPSDPVGERAAEIADLCGIIEAKIRQCLFERNRLERYITGVSDPLVREIMTLRFVNGLPWKQVAHCIGGRNSADSCRMSVCRWLSREKD